MIRRRGIGKVKRVDVGVDRVGGVSYGVVEVGHGVIDRVIGGSVEEVRHGVEVYVSLVGGASQVGIVKQGGVA